MQNVKGIYKTIIIISLVILMPDVNAQDSCAIFKHLKFNNGTATIVIKAYYDELVKSADYFILKKLDKEKRLKYKDYGDDSGEEDASAALGFIVENCGEHYTATLNNHIKTNLNNLKRGEIIYLTCVVFDGDVQGIRNYFVITGVALKKENYDSYPSIMDKKYLEGLPYSSKDNAGESYFIFGDWPVDYGFYVLRIDLHANAAVKFNKSLILFRRVSRKANHSGYIEEYRSKNYKLILKIDTIKNSEQAHTIRAGVLEIISKKADISFPIHGIDDEMDEYNRRKALSFKKMAL